jgi:hypothetical protein
MIDGVKLFVGDFDGYENAESFENRPLKLEERPFIKQ